MTRSVIPDGVLAQLTGERPPRSHTATEAHYLHNAVSGAINLFTLGLVDPGQRGPTTTVPPDDLEWKQAAPNTQSASSAPSHPTHAATP